MLGKRHSLRIDSLALWLLVMLSAPVIDSAARTRLSHLGSPATVAKSYRGSIGGSHIEMNLQTEGDKVSGTYSYDRIRQDIKVAGRINKQGWLELAEYDARGKQTGGFICKLPLGDPVDSECTWSRPNGGGERFVMLREQHITFTNGLRVVPKLITNRQTGVDVSYPQITGDTGPATVAAGSFNRLVSALVAKAIKDFAPGDDPKRNSFDTNYAVLLGTNNLISVEMYEYSDSGAAHPNDRYWALNYDLSANRELEFADLFKEKADYRSAIAEYVVNDINKRAEQLEREEAQREGRKAQPRAEPLMTIDQLSELASFAITPNGLMIYFDFPHVIAVFNKTFVPYSVVANHLQLVPPSNAP